MSSLAFTRRQIRGAPLPPLSPTGVALEPEAFRSLTCQELSSSFVVQLLPTGCPRFRLTPAGSLDSGHSKQTVTNFCVRYSVRSFLAPVNNLKSFIAFL
jgi:hypothetical protein